jgi:hypothetical protein
MIRGSLPVKSNTAQTDTSRGEVHDSVRDHRSKHPQRLRSHWADAHRPPAIAQSASTATAARPTAASTTSATTTTSFRPIEERTPSYIPRASKVKPCAIPANELQQPHHLSASRSPIHPRSETTVSLSQCHRGRHRLSSGTCRFRQETARPSGVVRSEPTCTQWVTDIQEDSKSGQRGVNEEARRPVTSHAGG